ncbi:MAG: tetratricopeptide repeat protein, partial [Bacteroidales bacterium]|nr:tetratricopeptide repeat protein [Bacteroidales bacterium]
MHLHVFGQLENKNNSSAESEKTINSVIEKAEYFLESNLDSAIYYGETAYRMAILEDHSKSKYQASKLIADAWYYKDSLSKAIDYYRIASEIIKEIEGEDSEEYASRISDIGYCFYSLNIFETAISYYNQALNIFNNTGNIQEISNQLNNLGTVYFAWGNFNRALENFNKTLRYDMQRKDSSALASSYNNIGKVYEAWGYYDQAIEHYFKSISFLGENGNLAKKAIRLSNIGTSYFRKNDFDKSIEYLYQALEIDQHLGNQFKIAIRYNELANAYATKGDYLKSINLNLNAQNILQSLDKKESLAIVLKDIGSNYFEMANYQLAENYLYKSISVSREVGSIANEMASYKMVAKVYEKKGDYHKAMDYHQKYIDLKDTIFNAQKHKQLANYRIRYETEKKESENKILKNDIQIKKRTQRTLIIIGILMLISSVLLFFLLRLKSQTLKKDRILYDKDKKLSIIELEKKDIEKQHLQDKVFAEQQLNRLQSEKHRAEIEFKNRELVCSTLQLVNKNEILSDIKNKIKLYNTVI